MKGDTAKLIHDFRSAAAVLALGLVEDGEITSSLLREITRITSMLNSQVYAIVNHREVRRVERDDWNKRPVEDALLRVAEELVRDHDDPMHNGTDFGRLLRRAKKAIRKAKGEA